MASIDELRRVIREELRAVPDAVWQMPLENHDTNPDDGVRPKKFAAKAYPVMANWRAAQNQIALANVTKLLGDINGKVTDRAMAHSLAKVLEPIVRQAALQVGVSPANADRLVEKVREQIDG